MEEREKLQGLKRLVSERRCDRFNSLTKETMLASPDQLYRKLTDRISAFELMALSHIKRHPVQRAHSLETTLTNPKHAMPVPAESIEPNFHYLPNSAIAL